MIICHVKYCIYNKFDEKNRNNTCSLIDTIIHDTGICFNKKVIK